MREKLNTNNIETDESIFNSEESDYKNLLTRLKEISLTIASLEKQFLNKF